MSKDKLAQYENMMRNNPKNNSDQRHINARQQDGFALKSSTGLYRRSGGIGSGMGVRTAWSGPLDRKGRLKIPDDGGVNEFVGEDDRHEFIEVAERVLHGRNATVFEGLILGPMKGLPRRSVTDLAQQFNVPAARIYRIKDDCIARVKSEFSKIRAARAATKVAAASETAETCNICGRTYAMSVWPRWRPICNGHISGMGVPDENLHPKCLISRRRAMWDRRKADLTPAKVADLRTELKDRLRAQKAAYEEWWARERLRSQRERLEVEAIVRAQREALNEAREMSELERIFGPPGHKGGRNDL